MRELERLLPITIAGLLAVSVVLQFLTLLAVVTTPASPVPTVKDQWAAFPDVPVGDKRNPMHVVVVNRSLSVDVENASLSVDVTNSLLDVNVQEHYIVSGDPIPVRLVK